MATLLRLIFPNIFIREIRRVSESIPRIVPERER